MDIINNELYAMHIPSDVLQGWKVMQAVHGICLKLSRRYTDYVEDTESDYQVNSLQCLREIVAMLERIQHCIWNNPRDNISAKSLDLMTRLFVKSSHSMDYYLNWVWTTHRDVQAE